MKDIKEENIKLLVAWILGWHKINTKNLHPGQTPALDDKLRSDLDIDLVEATDRIKILMYEAGRRAGR